MDTIIEDVNKLSSVVRDTRVVKKRQLVVCKSEDTQTVKHNSIIKLKAILSSNKRGTWYNGYHDGECVDDLLYKYLLSKKNNLYEGLSTDEKNIYRDSFNDSGFTYTAKYATMHCNSQPCIDYFDVPAWCTVQCITYKYADSIGIQIRILRVDIC
jgi:hypothetical protein